MVLSRPPEVLSIPISLSPTSRQHWELFQSENPEAVQAKTDLRWEMPNLVSAAILSSETQIEPMDEISSETLGLLHIETAVPKLVCVNLLYCYERQTMCSMHQISIRPRFCSVIISIASLYCKKLSSYKTRY